MGAWGEKPFENDAALDWLSELDGGGVAPVRAALVAAATAPLEEYLDADEGTAALAAARLVSAALGERQSSLPPEASAWLDAHDGSVTTEDAALARKAVERVLGEESELRALWDETGPSNEWRADTESLLSQLEDQAGGAVAQVPTQAASQVGDRDKQVLLTFMTARGLEPNAAQLARIREARDPAEIRRWLARVVSASSVEALLDG